MHSLNTHRLLFMLVSGQRTLVTQSRMLPKVASTILRAKATRSMRPDDAGQRAAAIKEMA